MKIERAKNAGRNIVVGTFLKIYQIAFPFVIRTVMIYYMSVEYLGLNGLFSSVIQVLNLAELGVSSAMVFSMYRPIVKDDCGRICALLKLYRRYYRIIGAVIAVLGLVLLPFLPYLIKTDTIPADIDVNVLYLMNLFNCVISYMLLAYRSSLMIAHQRNDIISRITLVTDTVMYLMQLGVIIFTKNYYLYTAVIVLLQMINNIICGLYSGKLYPQYKPEGEISLQDKAAISSRIRDLFTAKFGSVIVLSSDNIVVSAFLGLTVLAMYQNYYYILSAVIGIISVIFSACMSGLGNSFIVETKEKNYNDFKTFTFIISWIAGFCTSCFLCLYQPFMELWVGSELCLDFSAVICFCVYYYFFEINQLLNTYKDAAGIWHEDRFRPLVTAMTNLLMNLIMVQFWGIYGVLLSTVLSMMMIGMPWLIRTLFGTLFSKHLIPDYLKKLIVYTVVSAVACCITFFVCSLIQFDGIPGLLVKLAICIIVPNMMFLSVYFRTTEFHRACHLLEHITSGRIKLIKLFRLE